MKLFKKRAKHSIIMKDIKHPKKKFKKTERVPPEGYDSSNDFFEDVFMDKDVIWMGQNTNHLHGDIIADAMIVKIKFLISSNIFFPCMSHQLFQRNPDTSPESRF